MVFVLGNSGASAKSPKMSHLSTRFLLTAGSPPPYWSRYSRFCDCWSETIWVQSATSHKQTNLQINQPHSNTSSSYPCSSYHMPFVSPPAFLVAFCETGQTISNWYGLEKLCNFFSLLNQTSYPMLFTLKSSYTFALAMNWRQGYGKELRVSVLTSIATE